MAYIEDRWFDRSGAKTARHGTGKRWQLRWREPDGRERKLSYARKTDADDRRKALESDVLHGRYIDPKAGSITFDAYAAEWLQYRNSDPSTIEHTDRRLRLHVTGTALGKTPMGKIQPRMVQAWLSMMTVGDSTKRTVFDHVSQILSSAVEDGIITSNPAKAKSVTPPKRVRAEIVPWTDTQVAAMLHNIADRYRPLVMLGAWLGLRFGESAGLSPDDIDWLRGTITVTIRRQLKIVGNQRVFGPPKGGDGKLRTLPLSAALRDELAAYLKMYPAHDVTLPWKQPGGTPVTVPLLMTNQRKQPLHSASVTAGVWYPALEKSGISRGRTNGTHALRHYYASSALADGGDPVALATYLGHADPSYTFNVYGHFMPSAELRFTSAIDHAITRVQDEQRRLA